MDESLDILINETQEIEDDNYKFNLDIDEKKRNIYSIISFIIGIILNIILIINVENNNVINLFLFLMNNLCILAIYIFTYKDKYYNLITKNIILLILLLISIFFEFIIYLKNDNKITLIFILVIKNIIILYYLYNTIKIDISEICYCKM